MGAHVLLYSSEAEALRDILRDAFSFKHVDAGDGWLIFSLPPAELAIHPAEGPTFPRRRKDTSMHPSLIQVVAEMKAEDIRREAARYRLVRQAVRPRNDVKG